MELEDIYDLRIKLEDALIEIRLWDPINKKLKKEVRSLKNAIKPLLKIICKLEARLEGFGSIENKAPMGDEEAKKTADELEKSVEFCLKKYQEVSRLIEEEE
ncbi:MAG: hypothetical protein ACOC5T_09965 [Elusimicrobiota bacterium]